MTFCQHCGGQHAEDVRRCPKTGMMLSDPGPCGGLIDRYKVEKLLGIGGFGSVYHAVHTRTNVAVALKVLKKEKAEDVAAVDRFMREARAVAMVGSEHIVRVLDAEVSPDGIPFIAMELLEGQDLQQLDKSKGPLHPERLVGIMVQTLDGLAAAHDKGIIHRDMKPGNIFITKKKNPSGLERDFVKLLDFGISKIHQTNERVLTLAGTALGTPAYMAYEQFVDARSVDARADIYSVAVMLYELLARRLPYPASSYGELVIKIENETPPPLKEIVPLLPDRLCNVIDKGLKKNRDERWANAREFMEALQMVGTLRDVQLKTAIAMSAMPVGQSPAEQAETKLRSPSPTTEPGGVDAVSRDEERNKETVVRMPDSTVIMAAHEGPTFHQTQVLPGRDTQKLPGPRGSRPANPKLGDSQEIILPGRSPWELAAMALGVAVLIGAVVLWLALR